jgi:hypothetical protein
MTGEIIVMPTISMFYDILIRMFFHDTDKHNLPHIHAEYQGHLAVHSIPEGVVLAGELRRRSTSWSPHGLKYIKMIYWLIGNWRLMVRSRSQFEDLTNEHCRNCSQR